MVNFEKLVLFMVGGWYEVNFNDAFICRRVLDINWMGMKPKIGIPAWRRDKFVSKLVNAGYKVMIVKEIECYEDKQKRIAELKKQKKYTKYDNCTKREIREVKTQGTFCKLDQIGYQSRYLLVL